MMMEIKATAAKRNKNRRGRRIRKIDEDGRKWEGNTNEGDEGTTKEDESPSGRGRKAGIKKPKLLQRTP